MSSTPLLLLSATTPNRIISSARSTGFDVIIMPPAPGMAAPVASHPDMLLFAGFGSLFVRAAHMADENFARAIHEILLRRPNYKLVETDDTPSDKYPADVCFNCFVLGNSLICRADAVSDAIKSAASEAGTSLESMAQGYAKCSCAVINAPSGDAIISSDLSVIALTERLKIPSLKITPGNISLPGYDSGFIGGASFYSNGVLYFLGDYHRHPDGDAIDAFCRSLGIRAESLSDDILFDAGCLCI